MCAMLMDEWIKSAAISMFADLYESDDVMDQLSGLLQQQNNNEGGASPKSDMTIHPRISDIQRFETKKFSSMYAKQAATQMLGCLRDHIETCEVVHRNEKQTFEVNSTMIVLRGTIVCEANDKTATAPHIECWGPDFFDTVSATNSTWKVTSKDAVIFVYRRE